MNDGIRRFFDARGFLEVETPIAVPSPGLEPHLFAFETRAIGPDGRASTLYLHTSPEYAMKRVLGAGVGHIYQLARVFRNGERSRTHAPEFTMLEWYRCPGELHEIMDDVEALVASVADLLGGWRPRWFRRTSISEAFRAAGLGDPLEYEDTPSLRRALGISDPGPGLSRSPDTWEDVFFRAFLAQVEPMISSEGLTLLHGYPARMAALARVDRVDPRRAERFEAYAGGLELANAFGELIDPVEQRRRFEADIDTRRARNAPVYPIDEIFLRDLGRIPADGGAAGIALGVDRLLMLCLGAASVQDVITFSPREE